jgi:hypothetical protein
MILGDKFHKWANFPWIFPKKIFANFNFFLKTIHHEDTKLV